MICLPVFLLKFVDNNLKLSQMKNYRFIKSMNYALNGLWRVFTTEANMKIHLVIMALVIVFGVLFSISVTEWLICLICFGMVIAMEMMNTALEKWVDFVSPEYHTAAGLAKDIAAGAVLITAFFAAVAGLIIFVPKGWKAVCTLFC